MENHKFIRKKKVFVAYFAKKKKEQLGLLDDITCGNY